MASTAYLVELAASSPLAVRPAAGNHSHATGIVRNAMRKLILVLISVMLAGPAYTQCANQYASGSAAQSGFGVPWNTQDLNHALTSSVSCTASNTTFTIGSGDPHQLVWKHGARYVNGAWQSFDFTGTQSLLAPDWLTSSGTYSTGSAFSTRTPVAGYVCQYVSGAWKCGCVDATCSSNLSQLQAAVASAPEIIAPGQPDPATCVNINSYGGDIANAVSAAANTTARCVYAPAGSYAKNQSVYLNNIKVVGDGDSTVFNVDVNHAIYGQSRWEIQGGAAGNTVASGVYSMKIVTDMTGRTRADGVEAPLQIDRGANHWVLDNITVSGGGAGIFNYGGHDGRITRNRVLNTLADATHQTSAAYNIYIAGNVVRNPGDDMIPQVGYTKNSAAVSDVLVENNNLANQPWGRGVLCAGCVDSTIRNNTIVQSSDAGILVGNEAAWPTKTINNVIVEGNTIDQCPHAHAADHGQGSMLLYTQTSNPVQNVYIHNNVITNAPNGPWQFPDTNTVNIYCQGNTYNGAPSTPPNCTTVTGTPAGITGASIDATLLGGTTVPYQHYDSYDR